MNDDIKPESSAIPPRVTIKVPGQTGEVAEGASPMADSTVGTTLPGNKKQTSRITLDKVTAEPGATLGSSVSGLGVASKTIRLAPAVTGQVSISPLPPVGKALSGALISDDGKRQTSRIPLDAVLTGKGESAGDAIPKTIKVKRPVLSSVSKVTGLPTEAPAVVPAPPPAGMMSSKNQTARVDIVPEAAETQQTQKKTIKIRRADGAASDIKAGPRSVTIARGEEGAGSAGEGAEVAPPHVIFPIMAAAAMLVLCFMLYVLAAQAFPHLGWSVGV